MAKWPAGTVSVTEIEPGLHCLSAGDAMQRYAYLLQHRQGNVLLHGPDNPAFYVNQRRLLDDLGGFTVQLLTHGPEASSACNRAHREFGAPVRVQAFDGDIVRRRVGRTVPVETWEQESTFRGLKAYRLPGHTVGFSAFRYRGQRGVYLFTGDIAVPTKTVWRGGGDLEAYRYSLGRMEKLKFDFLLPNKGRADLPPPIAFDRATRKAAFGELLVDLERRTRGRRRSPG